MYVAQKIQDRDWMTTGRMNNCARDPTGTASNGFTAELNDFIAAQGGLDELQEWIDETQVDRAKIAWSDQIFYARTNQPGIYPANPTSLPKMYPYTAPKVTPDVLKLFKQPGTKGPWITARFKKEFAETLDKGIMSLEKNLIDQMRFAVIKTESTHTHTQKHTQTFPPTHYTYTLPPQTL
jgi:hypothetical protein